MKNPPSRLPPALSAGHRTEKADDPLAAFHPAVAGWFRATFPGGPTPAQAAAWPLIAAGLDGAIAVDDAASATAARDLASEGVAAGPCGAAPLAGLRALRADRDSAGPGDRLDLGPGSLVVLLVTEGAEANPQT